MARRIAVYGGSFSPFGGHHQQVVQWLVREGGYDHVMVVPAIAHALKGSMPRYEHRYNMCRLAVQDLVRTGRLPEAAVSASTIEMDLLLEQAAPVRTYELLAEVRRRSPEAGIQFAIGPDILAELDRWARVPDIRRDFGFAHAPGQSMRATQIREMIAAGDEGWVKHVPESVRRYIEMHGLYSRQEQEGVT